MLAPSISLLQTNGQLSTANGLAEQDELSLQEGALDSQQEEVSTADVGQRESEDVSERDSSEEMAAHSAVVQDITCDGPDEMPEIIEQIPSSESNLEDLTQPPESQANDIGFKKVFKFVGFKFTVKKDKTEKSDNVQLLTVKKDEGEGAVGAGDHQEPSLGAEEAASQESELKQPIEKPEGTLRHEQGTTEVALPAEFGQAVDEGKGEGEEKQEREPRSAESPTSPVASETTSSFKKFFTQGWAGWRKKTSFRKPKEEELDASEKKKDQEPEKGDTEEHEKADDGSEKPTVSALPHPPELTESDREARLSADYEKVEMPSDEQVDGLQGSSADRPAPLATEVFDEKIEGHQEEVVAEIHISTAERTTDELETKGQETVEALPPGKSVEASAEPQEGEPPTELEKTKDACVSGGDQPQGADLSPDEKVVTKHSEAIVSEAEMLSSQERMKVQGSPLKKLFTSTGLKKLSGKKQKGKRGGGGDEESGEQSQVPVDSPDSNDEQKGESSASSPEEPEEITCLEKGLADGHQDVEAEEGATSDGEKKREGVTPWASFKKMVTPKKRVRRPSESDREEELDKVKSATLSSTESAASEMQEEPKGIVEEQRPEEPKRKVDTSVSWEALICVGSSKKRARKASSSDDEGGPAVTGGDGQRADEAGRDKEVGADATLASSQEHDQGQGSSSPEQAGSPSEGEGVSTWESFKRLVTPRKKSKSKLEEKNEDSGAGPGVEHSASDAEPGKEESWVSIKKFIPGRRKKRSDGKQEQATTEDTGLAEANEDDSDVPAVVPLSEYDAVEREKLEALQTQERAEKPKQEAAACVSEELSKSLVHTVAVAVIDGTRAVTSIEERSPSWISASVIEPLEQAEDEATIETREVFERDVTAGETPMVTKPSPENRRARDDSVVGEVELMSGAVTAAEATGAFCPEEATEASGAEETTEMVSAVSQLTDSPDTTEEATPVQEAEGGVPDLEEQERQTHEVLQAVAEKVKEGSRLPGTGGPGDALHTTQKEESETPEEGSGAPVLKKEMADDAALKVYIQEMKTEPWTQGEGMLQTTPESFEKAPEVTERAEARELTTICHTETSAGVKSRAVVMEQAALPDSVETPTDSETSGSIPVADVGTLETAQQDKMVETPKDGDVASVAQPGVTEAEAVPVQIKRPLASSGLPSQEERKEQSKMEDAVEHTDKEGSVETVPLPPKTEAIQEAGQLAGEETKGGPSIVGLEVSVDADVTVSQEKAMEAVLKDEVMKEAECQKNDNIELQSAAKSLPRPEEREMEVQVERKNTEAKPTHMSDKKLEQKMAGSEELHELLVQTVNATVLDGEKEVGSLEGSPLPPLSQEEAAHTEIQVQSAEAPFTLTAAAGEEKVLGVMVRVLGTGEALESASAHLVLEEKASEKDEDFTAQPGEEAVSTGPESQAESVAVTVSATTEKGFCSDLDGEKTKSLRWKLDEVEGQAACQEVTVVAAEEVFKAESEIVEIQTESSKLVQNIIQTAVDQFVRTEEIATEMVTLDLQIQAPPMKADTQRAEQEAEEEDSKHEASALDETHTFAAKEESELTVVEQARSGISKDVSDASEKSITAEVESSSVNDQQLEEVILPSKEEGDGTGTQSGPEDDGCATLGEMKEKSLFESKEDKERDGVHGPEKQNSALEDTDASGGAAKDSPDTNGPKRTGKAEAQEVKFQEGKVHSEPDKETRTSTQEEVQKQESEPTTSELTES
ncbi:A-kinase anchor protein 12 [Carlito syrichta]|uniref:A-kinase anchor protein 12 n=1 Tax=Carlito syrichta TaxID=1868482 RepID=A0A1U7UD21_CARSF|nr:A-kinase anchor protein 12 [Carlito syrichta]